mmetsp:Transcript_17199/g.22373  ORF Transcript_17199/g.22373 Transcript_17199/m.22373 type:complete len:353 (+) Transcript_17199:207-1265(+)
MRTATRKFLFFSLIAVVIQSSSLSIARPSDPLIPIDDDNKAKQQLVISSTVQTIWDQQQKWSILASRKRNAMAKWRNINFYLIFASTCLQVIGSQLPGTLGKVCSVARIVSLGAVPVINEFKLGSDELADHVKCRQVAEMIKSEVYKYYATEDSEEALKKNVDKILNDDDRPLYGLLLEYDGMDMQDVETRPIPHPDEREVTEWYNECRLADQIKFRERRMGKMLKTARWYKNVGKVVYCVTALAGVFSGISFFKGGGVFEGVIETLMITAYGFFNKRAFFESMVTNLSSSKKKLKELHDSWDETKNEMNDNKAGDTKEKSKWESYVDQCEDILVGENKAWGKIVVEGKKNS